MRLKSSIHRFWLAFLFLASTPAFVSKPARAESSGGSGPILVIFPERQQERRQSRWTLADWFEQRKTIAAQNFWLAQHTNKVPVDLTLTSGVAPMGNWSTDVDFFLLWLGLQAHYEKSLSSLEGFYADSAFTNHSGDLALQIRLFGGNIQDTNLIVRASYEYDDLANFATTPRLDGAYAGFGLGPELQIYFAQWLGLRADWRYDFSRKNLSRKELSFSGHRYSAVGFLEMGSLRLEAGYQSRVLNFSDADQLPSTTVGTFDHSGLVGRLRLFF